MLENVMMTIVSIVCLGAENEGKTDRRCGVAFGVAAGLQECHSAPHSQASVGGERSLPFDLTGI